MGQVESHTASSRASSAANILGDKFESRMGTLFGLSEAIEKRKEIRSKLLIEARSYENIECTCVSEGWNRISYVFEFKIFRDPFGISHMFDVCIEIGPLRGEKDEYVHVCAIESKDKDKEIVCYTGIMRPLDDRGDESIKLLYGTVATSSTEAGGRCLSLIMHNWNQLSLFI